MEQAIIVLVIVGFLMIGAEVFVPGLVLGILGALCLITSVILAYLAFGPLIGTAAFAALALLSILGFILWMRIFPHTPIGSRLILKDALVPDNATPTPSYLGQQGTALTPLRPAGTVRISGQRVDVVAESGFIETGENVSVVFQEGLRVVVRKEPSPVTADKKE